MNEPPRLAGARARSPDRAVRRRTAVRELASWWRAGEIVGLIGPNGAGKSTTLHAIMGAVPVATAMCAVRPVGPRSRARGDRALRRRTRPRGPQDLRRADGRGEPPARDRRASRPRGGRGSDGGGLRARSRRARVRPPAGRCAVGRAAAAARDRSRAGCRPDMLLLDEPSLGLAPRVVDIVFDALAEIRRRGITVLLVEQRAQRTVAFADRTYLMANGEVRLRSRPADADDTEAMVPPTSRERRSVASLDAQTIVDAVGLGAVYALMAVGIGLVFGVLRLVNFAYGQVDDGRRVRARVHVAGGLADVGRHRDVLRVVVVALRALMVGSSSVRYDPVAGRDARDDLRRRVPAPEHRAPDECGDRSASRQRRSCRSTARSRLERRDPQGDDRRDGRGGVCPRALVLLLERTRSACRCARPRWTSPPRACWAYGQTGDRVAVLISALLAATVAVMLTIQFPLVTPGFALKDTIVVLAASSSAG